MADILRDMRDADDHMDWLEKHCIVREIPFDTLQYLITIEIPMPEDADLAHQVHPTLREAIRRAMAKERGR